MELELRKPSPLPSRPNSISISLLEEEKPIELSVYRFDKPLSIERPEEILRLTDRILNLFPKMNEKTVSSILGVAVKTGKTYKQIADGIDHLSLTHQYQTFVPAQLLGFDKKCKYYNHHQYGEYMAGKGLPRDTFSHVRLKGKLFWVLTEDKIMFNIPDEIN